MSPEERIKELKAILAENGLQLDEVAHLEAALQVTKRPLHKRALSLLKANWNRVKGEFTESVELSALLKKARKEGKNALSDTERDIIKTQLKDFFRVFPAAIVAGVNSALPIPGTGFFTPFLLRKMGLLPSRWREAYILKTLQKAHSKLKQEGSETGVALITDLEHDIEEEAQRRNSCDLLAVWDANQNGVWDEDEIKAYQQEVQRTQTFLRKNTDRKDWFLMHNGLVFGPTSLDNLPQGLDNLLVCYQDTTQWIKATDLLATTTTVADCPP